MTQPYYAFEQRRLAEIIDLVREGKASFGCRRQCSKGPVAIEDLRLDSDEGGWYFVHHQDCKR